MAVSQALGGSSRAGKILGPSLDKIIKNAAWRKHGNLVSSCKAALDRLEGLSPSPDAANSSSPLVGLALSDAEAVLQPIILALESSYVKVIEPALECLQKLFLVGIVRGEVGGRSDGEDGDDLASRVLGSVCKCGNLGDEAVELGMLRVFISAVRSPLVDLRGPCLVQILKSCYNVYLGSHSGVNQLCAKAIVAQILKIVYARVETNRMVVTVQTIAITDVLDLSDKNLNDSNLLQAAQNFIKEVVDGTECVNSLGDESENVHSSVDECTESGWSSIQEDGFFLFKNLCKFSMKVSTHENPEDPLLIRGKLLSLELLNNVIDDAGPVWRTNEKFLGAIKQYLCLSLLKNSAFSSISIFQLLCSIFTSLMSKFRSGLKGEIGIFFPMLILRVLENVLQPSFLQKMTVLNLLEKVCQDSQIIIDIFVNYDCDVDAPNIFERTVNGLLKTALGVPPGSSTTLSPAQDLTLRNEAVKCLVCIIKSIGFWMDQQQRVGEVSPKISNADSSTDNQSSPIGEEGTSVEFDLQSEVNADLSDAFTLEQRRTYKKELQRGISLFNRKPSKGIEFLLNSRKIGEYPQEVAAFLRGTGGLNKEVIGDYLGDREEFPLKVMHAYVDSFAFDGMDFGEAIRFFLQGFRLPGEAQKIDRIMEKFAERYCKCNPNSFTSADTAYVLAYSVIMLNTDAHNVMVKHKMSKADFIHNNRGIDGGKDLPVAYLGSLYDQIVNNEIKMNANSSVPQSRQANGLNKLFNLVTRRQSEEKAVGANDLLIKHIQEQFKANSGKSELYYTVKDTSILRFMMDVCWAPMLAAFSVTLDQSDEKTATCQCLDGFRHAVHVTSVMSMQTQRDAFVTSVAKFTYLHCAADMKQKNVDAVKTIMTIAIEDGDFLQESWEHVLTCLSRFENLQLLGEGSPPDASYFTEEKARKSTGTPTHKKKINSLQNPAMVAAVLGGSYDSNRVGTASGLVSPEQITHLISNLNLLDQIGSFELNHIFAHSQRLNSEAIVAFVKALCKVSMAELLSPSDPRIFSLTKIVEIAHYNMGRIRLVWSHIWSVLSEFFVTVGTFENLSVAIFVMDSLRQLSMKFLEREELANYNFQKEFLHPFVVVMQKSSSAEIRELVVRCVSQMVLSRVGHVKSGWKSVFLVFTLAASDERKSVVLLAFETMEKIVRDYFPYITETETTTFTDCVKCLLTFTSCKLNSDVSLNAIAFLRFCAVKLAEGGLVCYDKKSAADVPADGAAFTEHDDYVYYWVPLLAGLSRLTSDPRTTIGRGALEVLFNILRDHGRLFSRPFWMSVFKSVVFPIFDGAATSADDLGDDVWTSGVQPAAAKCLVDLFVDYFDVGGSLLGDVALVLTGFSRSPHNGAAATGLDSLLRLTAGLDGRLTEEDWAAILAALKEAAASALTEFSRTVQMLEKMEIHEFDGDAAYSDQESDDDDQLEAALYAIARMKGQISVQLLLSKTITKMYEVHSGSLSEVHVVALLDALSSMANQAGASAESAALRRNLRRACGRLDVAHPPLVHFQNEALLARLDFIVSARANETQKLSLEPQLVAAVAKIVETYLACAAGGRRAGGGGLWEVPLGARRREELAARAPPLVAAVRTLARLEKDAFRRHIPCLFPSLVELVRCEHSSGEVQLALGDVFESFIGPIIRAS
ncbi:SEC7-like guanine nucleotide exchange family protein [Wolffia australiana]